MIFFFFFLVMLYSNFVMNTLEKIPGAATVSELQIMMSLKTYIKFIKIAKTENFKLLIVISSLYLYEFHHFCVPLF
jgi:hypothetical protein